MPPRRRRASPPASPSAAGPIPAAVTTLADRLHSAAIHLLRRVRVQDEASGLRAPALSALSVIVFGGPISLGELARAEGVQPPTITRIVDGLEHAGLALREADPEDRRVQRVRATARGRAVLTEGRARRVHALAQELRAFTPAERATLERAASLLERLLGRPH